MRSYMLILEIDDDTRRSIVELFQGENFDVVEEADSSEGITHVIHNNPGIIIMAEDMPPLDGVELLPLLRRLTRAPIIVVGRGGETAVVKALMDGADMYLRKPLNYRELMSRVRALFRRAGQEFNSVSPEVSQPDFDDLFFKDVKASLTETESKLLMCLIEKSGRVVGHEELMIRVWGGPVGRGRLRFYIHSLRRKLGDAVSISLYTQKGVGYRLLRSAYP